MRIFTRTLTAAVLAAGCLASAASAAQAGTTTQAGPVPKAPSGWRTVFSDSFQGRTGMPPSRANWFYDIGTNYGTGEIERTTHSTRNVYLDGRGHLVLRALGHGGSWTSARIETTRDDFAAPPGGELKLTASIEQPNPADGLGYWPAFWALGSPMRTGGTWPTSGEIDMMEDVNGLNEASQTLHDAAGSDGHPLTACPGAGSTCQTGYHTYTVLISRRDTRAEYLQFRMDGRTIDTITEAEVGATAWRQAIDHGFFIILDLAMGGNYPDGECNCTAPAAATTSGGTIRLAYVAVYEKGGHAQRLPKPTATGPLTGFRQRCLSNSGSLNTEGNPMVARSCTGRAGQRWSVYPGRTLRTEGGCLDVAGAGKASGTPVDWYPCNGTAAQDWTHAAHGELVNPVSGLCLTDPGGRRGSRLDIETCTGSAQQRWTLPRR